MTYQHYLGHSRERRPIGNLKIVIPSSQSRKLFFTLFTNKIEGAPKKIESRHGSPLMPRRRGKQMYFCLPRQRFPLNIFVDSRLRGPSPFEIMFYVRLVFCIAIRDSSIFYVRCFLLTSIRLIHSPDKEFV